MTESSDAAAERARLLTEIQTIEQSIGEMVRDVRHEAFLFEKAVAVAREDLAALRAQLGRLPGASCGERLVTLRHDLDEIPAGVWRYREIGAAVEELIDLVDALILLDSRRIFLPPPLLDYLFRRASVLAERVGELDAAQAGGETSTP